MVITFKLRCFCISLWFAIAAVMKLIIYILFFVECVYIFCYIYGIGFTEKIIFIKSPIYVYVYDWWSL